MKNKLLKAIFLLTCISAMILGTALVVSAADMEEVITAEHNLTISPQKQNAGYVYVNAQVPKGWGGEIRVAFHNRSTGRDYICSMSYLENEYHSGLWLPAGSYLVSPELPLEDGLCELKLQNSDQEILQVKSGDNLYLTILAVEIPDTDAPTELIEATVIPPKNQEEYQDLPTVAAESEAVEAETEQAADPEEVPEDATSLSGIIRILAVILVIIVVILTIHYMIQEHQNQGS